MHTIIRMGGSLYTRSMGCKLLFQQLLCSLIDEFMARLLFQKLNGPRMVLVA